MEQSIQKYLNTHLYSNLEVKNNRISEIKEERWGYQTQLSQPRLKVCCCFSLQLDGLSFMGLIGSTPEAFKRET